MTTGTWIVLALLAYVLIALALDFYWLYRKEQNTYEETRAWRNDAVALSQKPFKGSQHGKGDEQFHAATDRVFMHRRNVLARLQDEQIRRIK